MIRDGTFPFWSSAAGNLRKRCAAVVMAIIVAAGCATTPSSPPEPPPPPGQTIAVQPGQTLWQIARESGVDVEEIVEVNGLRSADDIAAGQLLFIPAATQAQATPKALPPKPPKPAIPTATTALAWPVNGVVLRDFATAKAKSGAYDGVLIAAPAETAVLAAAPGRVAFAGSQETALGVFVIVEHTGVNDDLVTIYAHLASASVKVGDVVAAGDVLGVVGTSGLVGSSPRVQFQVRRQQVAVDPLPLLPP